MLIYALRRLGVGLAIFLTVTGVMFFLFNLNGPVAIAAKIIGANPQPGQLEATISRLGLDQPLPVRYVEWLSGVVRGDFGRSFITNQPVSEIMAGRIPVTVSVLAITIVLTVVVGVLLGVLAATRGGLIDRGLQLLSVLLEMIPPFVLALVVVLVFAINLKLFPATGYISINRSILGWLSTVALPSVSIATVTSVSLALWVRSSIIDLLRRDFVRTLRSRGLSEAAVLYKHVLRNAAAPTLTILGIYVIVIAGGVVIVERIYALPGIGLMTLTAGLAGDIPVVLGSLSFLVLIVVGVNLTIDLLNGVLDPKARLT